MSREPEVFWMRVELRRIQEEESVDPDAMAEQVKLALMTVAATHRRMLRVDWFVPPGPMTRWLLYRKQNR